MFLIQKQKNSLNKKVLLIVENSEFESYFMINYFCIPCFGSLNRFVSVLIRKVVFNISLFSQIPWNDVQYEDVQLWRHHRRRSLARQPRSFDDYVGKGKVGEKRVLRRCSHRALWVVRRFNNQSSSRNHWWIKLNRQTFLP